MWLLERHVDRRLTCRLACIACLGGLVAGCFQPLYGEHSLTNSPAVGPALAGVDVNQIPAPNGTSEARVAVEVRNQLLFNLTGGAEPPPPTHRLAIRMSSNRMSVIVDITSGRPDVEDYGLNAYYTLTEIKSGKQVVTGTTFARVSYDIPGQAQRFARSRGLRDAENRAAKQIADNIKARLASYFVAGT
ncbi:MAG TPA: LPS assembly lipoprotein LptE [Xanthobacteraceae bacterium]|nr:LPS assembly lipoprotein LptE [Xanthobacteraceae bacterium]